MPPRVRIQPLVDAPIWRIAAVLLLSWAVGALIGCSSPENVPLRLATTTSVKDSGLLDALLPAFSKSTGIEVGVISVGTGMALRLAERGEADVVITHDREREEAFIRAGHARERRVFAYSDFVIVGPPEDPAGIRGKDVLGAFEGIANSGARFASRGDSSGTHSRELELWKATGVSRQAGSAYVEVRAGMATTLQFAGEKKAYTLTDRATYLVHRHRLGLEVLVNGDPLLENVYAVMVVDPGRHGRTDARRAEIFAKWLLSKEARAIISSLRREGETLFRTAPGAPGHGRGPAADRQPGSSARQPGPDGRITVSAAISLKEALEDMVPGFTASHPGTAFELNLGGSGELRRQIEAGAPVDVFVSAGAAEMDALSSAGHILARTRREIACNRLVVVVPAGNRRSPRNDGRLRDLAGLAGLGRVAIGDPASVPAGRYARQALEAAGLWRSLASRLIFTQNVRQALEYVSRGEVEAAFVYATDAGVRAGEVELALTVNPGMHDRIAYSAAAVAGSRRPVLAASLVEFLASATARAVLRRHGFELPSCNRS